MDQVTIVRFCFNEVMGRGWVTKVETLALLCKCMPFPWWWLSAVLAKNFLCSVSWYPGAMIYGPFFSKFCNHYVQTQVLAWREWSFGRLEMAPQQKTNWLLRSHEKSYSIITSVLAVLWHNSILASAVAPCCGPMYIPRFTFVRCNGWLADILLPWIFRFCWCQHRPNELVYQLRPSLIPVEYACFFHMGKTVSLNEMTHTVDACSFNRDSGRVATKRWGRPTMSVLASHHRRKNSSIKSQKRELHGLPGSNQPCL